MESFVNITPVSCSKCDRILKGPLALKTHDMYAHNIHVPLVRGKRMMRMPMASELKEALDCSITVVEAARYLSISVTTFRKWCKELIPSNFEIFMKNRPGRGWKHKTTRERRPIHKKMIAILEGRETRPVKWNDKVLLEKLIREGLVEEKCELCSFDERRMSDYKVPLIVDYVDNDPCNCKRDNLRLLCYNCYFLNVGKKRMFS